MKRTHAAALAALVALSVPTLTGCFQGQQATTTVQAENNSGNGVETDQGAMHIENATLVRGPEGSKSATLLMRIVNVGPKSDALTYVTINGTKVDIFDNGVVADKGVDIGAGQSVSFGFQSNYSINAYDFDVPPSSYVPVELGFADAGLAKLSVLTVPPLGYYEGIVPNPPSAPAIATPAPSASAAPAASASAAPAASASAAPEPSASVQ